MTISLLIFVISFTTGIFLMFWVQNLCRAQYFTRSFINTNYGSEEGRLLSPTDRDPACVINADCARAFTLLHWLNLRYGLYCFGFHGCKVVYPVPHTVFIFTVALLFIQYRINLG